MKPQCNPIASRLIYTSYSLPARVSPCLLHLHQSILRLMQVRAAAHGALDRSRPHILPVTLAPMPAPTPAPTDAPTPARGDGFCTWEGCKSGAQGCWWCNGGATNCALSCDGAFCLHSGEPPITARNYRAAVGLRRGGRWGHTSSHTCTNESTNARLTRVPTPAPKSAPQGDYCTSSSCLDGWQGSDWCNVHLANCVAGRKATWCFADTSRPPMTPGPTPAPTPSPTPAPNPAPTFGPYPSREEGFCNWSSCDEGAQGDEWRNAVAANCVLGCEGTLACTAANGPSNTGARHCHRRSRRKQPRRRRLLQPHTPHQLPHQPPLP